MKLANSESEKSVLGGSGIHIRLHEYTVTLDKTGVTLMLYLPLESGY